MPDLSDDRDRDREPDLFLPGDDFQAWQRPVRVSWDDDEPDPEATTYTAATPGPQPVPSWVITEDAARQREVGLLKTGKEADVHVVERRLGDRRNLLAAKRYRQRRAFHNDLRYRANRRTGSRRLDLAAARNTALGRTVRARQWAVQEFAVLSQLWSGGVAVPYPVQLLGDEVMVQFLGDDDQAALRLVDTRPTPRQAAGWSEQIEEILRGMADLGIVHGDLSPYNVLVWEDTLYVIDLPQAQIGAADADTLLLLEHDVLTICRWFDKRGATIDSADLLADLIVAAMQ